MGGESMTYWDVHKLHEGLHDGLLNGPKQVYLALACNSLIVRAGPILGIVCISNYWVANQVRHSASSCVSDLSARSYLFSLMYVIV